MAGVACAHVVSAAPAAAQSRVFTPTPTQLSRVSPTLTVTATHTATPQFTATGTATSTVTPTASASATHSIIPRDSATPTASLSATPAASPTWTRTPIATASATQTASATFSRPTPSATAPPTVTVTETAVPSATLTPTRTATPTRTRTPTPTKTRTPTKVPTPIDDLVATALEVTQAVQDLNNSVRLVKGKTTYVRFHVHSTKNPVVATASLRAELNGKVTYLKPINKTSPAGSIQVRTHPGRGILNHAFLFSLPTEFRQGTVKLTAEINPGRTVAELSYLNNALSTTVAFETVPRISLVLYRMAYKVGSNIFVTPAKDVEQMLEWVLWAYPVREREFWLREHAFSKHPDTCKKVNGFLMAERAWDLAHGKDSIPRSARYYGMVTEAGGWMTGCAPVPGFAGSGPTGTRSMGWDFDGSFGDWYAGHELGHSFGREHAEYCGAKDGAKYPYSGGKISPTPYGPDALYGFGLGQKIYGPFWYDVMTYCPYEWISDFTYHGIMNYLQGCIVSGKDICLWWAGGAGAAAETSERLLVIGSIDPATHEVELEPLFVIPVEGEVPEPVPGDHAIVLRAAGGSELARYPFTPLHADPGPPSAPDTATDRDLDALFINEMVPFVAGTVRVDIEGPGGALLGGVTAGASPPSVTVLSPNGGELFTDDTFPVHWTASDPDADPLVFQVQFSPDNGTTWQVIARDVTDTAIELDRGAIPGARQGLVRVWASDGIHTASDASDASFTAANHVPQVEILDPQSGETFASGQTVHLSASAYDVETGTMEAGQVRWLSDRDGELGADTSLAVEDLGVGPHTITFEARDAEGATASSSVQIQIVSDLAEVPPPPAALNVEPLLLSFDAREPSTGETVFLENPAGGSIRWQATTEVPWLRLGQTEGETPAEVVVAIDELARPAERANATVTFTSPDLPGVEVGIGVEWLVPLPCVGDCDANGAVTVDELLLGIHIALGAAELDSCRSFDSGEDGRVAVEELVQAVSSALSACAGG